MQISQAIKRAGAYCSTVLVLRACRSENVSALSVPADVTRLIH